MTSHRSLISPRQGLNAPLSLIHIFAKDYNGDGVVTVDFKEEVYIPEMVNSKPNELSSSDKFNLELALGDCVIYIMDESFYRGNKDYMCDLKEILGFLPEAYYDCLLYTSTLPHDVGV